MANCPVVSTKREWREDACRSGEFQST